MYRSELMVKPIRLIIPEQYRQDINPHDGRFYSKSPYYNCSIRKLFMDRINYEYVFKELVLMIRNKKFVFDNMPDAITNRDMVANMLAEKITDIQPLLYKWMEDNKVQNWESTKYNNVPYQLSEMNRDFVLQHAAIICQTPQIVVADIDRINPDSGEIEYGESDYDPSSYFGGTWRPEDLFMNTANNRNSGHYWRPYAYGVDITPAAAGVNNVYNRDIYGFKSRFPTWQTSVQRRNYDRDQEDMTNGQGAITDYAVQGTKGYDMRALTKIPHTK